MTTRRIRLGIEFDGKPFTGWQRQTKGISVQSELESALEKVVGHAVRLHAAGRTDSGVHALGMVAHFDTSSRIPAERLVLALEAFLPNSISVVSSLDADPKFDSRRDALLRWYRYQIDTDRRRHPLGPRAWRVFQSIDFSQLKHSVTSLQGKHDFAGFRAASCKVERTILTMQEASVIQRDKFIVIDFKCQSFLQRMVRLMVGAAAEVAMGKFSREAFLEIRDTGHRKGTLRAAPADGLCLMGIAYSEAEAEKLLTRHPSAPSF